VKGYGEILPLHANGRLRGDLLPLHSNQLGSFRFQHYIHQSQPKHFGLNRGTCKELPSLKPAAQPIPSLHFLNLKPKYKKAL